LRRDRSPEAIWKIKKAIAICAALAGAAVLIWFYIEAGPEFWEIPERGRGRLLGPFIPVFVYGGFLFILYSWLLPEMLDRSDD
jgi:hypothetical protein